MLELLSSSELIDLMLTTSDETSLIKRIFKCSRMPYTDRERKEIVEEIVRRQAHRILKVYLRHALLWLLENVYFLKSSGKPNLEAT